MKKMLLLFYFIFALNYAHAQACSPAKTGNPCATSYRAPKINAGVGNPIHLLSGNKFQQENDLPMRPSGIEVVRYYNAMSSQNTPFGQGWQLSYNSQLFMQHHTWQILTADGRRIMFYPPRNNIAKAVKHYHGHIEGLSQQWHWINPNGVKYVFNQYGYLLQIHRPGLPTIYINRLAEKGANASAITQVSAGKEALSFHYRHTDHGLTLNTIDTPIGHFSYRYDIPNGHKHHRPIAFIRNDEAPRQYLYEEKYQSGHPYRLTGIRIPSGAQQTMRINTWRYDKSGKAIYSSVGTPAYDELHIEYAQEALKEGDNALTIVRNRTGEKTVIKGQIKGSDYLITEVSGKGCYLCPPVGTIAQYNEQGFLSHLNGYHIERDTDNRVTQIAFTHPFWGNITLNYNAQGKVTTWSSTHSGTRALNKNVRANFNEKPKDAHPFVTLSQHALSFKNNTTLKAFNLGSRWQFLLLSSDTKTLWAQARFYGENGLLRKEIIGLPTQRIHTTYLYDQAHHLRAANQQHKKQSDLFYYTWEASGASRAYAINHATTLPAIRRNHLGLPIQIGSRTLQYNNHYRIASVHENKRTIARYEYDKYGRRIKKTLPTYTIRYRYLAEQLSTEVIENKTTHRTHERNYFYAGVFPVAFTEKITENKKTLSEKTYYIHNDHIGQASLVTDEQQHIVWAAHYSPTGKAHVFKEDIVFNLRQSGQYFDQETGWHDNYFRTYDPDAGHYLEPDPLGPVTWNDPFGYAAQQPRQFIDPLGLLLFAFDGTGNNKQSNTNVLKFYHLYKGAKFYKEGPGGIPGENYLKRKIGFLFAGSTNDILDEHKKNLIDYMREKNNDFNKIIPIDIVGFSRGAAIGMIFANYVKSLVKDNLFSYQHTYTEKNKTKIETISTCVDLRFIGLFDTVPQFGPNGLTNPFYDYTASSEWGLITHAVALNEYRYLLPVTTYAGAPNVNEQGFLGNHSTMGGVFVPGDKTDAKNPHPQKVFGDLSHLPLAWTYTQAQNMGVDLHDLHHYNQVEHNFLNEIKNPVMHNTYGEYSRAFNWFYHNLGIPPLTARERDRNFEYPSKLISKDKQGKLAHLGDKERERHITAADVKFVDAYSSLGLMNVGIFGELNAKKYITWLEDTLGWASPLNVIPH